jgi:hypothetical protein
VVTAFGHNTETATSGLMRDASCGCDVCVLERATDALYRSRIDAKTFGNLSHPLRPSGFVQGRFDRFFQIGGYRRPTKTLSFTSGPRQASTDPLLDHRPLELGKHAHHLEHGFAEGVVVSSPCWCR